MTPDPTDQLRANKARVSKAASLARIVIGGATGELVYRRLTEWCNEGHRYDVSGEGIKVAADLEARYAARRSAGAS